MRRIAIAITLVALTSGLVLVAGTAGAAGRYTVTAIANTTKLDVGQSLTLRGRVSPNAKGEPVVVQRRTGSTWTTVKRAKLNSSSRYVVSVKVTQPGDSLYRVVKARSHGHLKGFSPTRTVTAFRWRWVKDLPLSTYPGQSTFGIAELASGVLMGTTYAPFIETSSAGAGGNGYYRLDGKCTQLDVHVGGSQSSATPTSGSSFIFTSPISDPGTIGPVIFSGATNKTIDPFHVVRGPSVMSTVAVMEFRSSGGDAGDLVGWGSARVYCKS